MLLCMRLKLVIFDLSDQNFTVQIYICPSVLNLQTVTCSIYLIYTSSSCWYELRFSQAKMQMHFILDKLFPYMSDSSILELVPSQASALVPLFLLWSPLASLSHLTPCQIHKLTLVCCLGCLDFFLTLLMGIPICLVISRRAQSTRFPFILG